jgi:hypothetical protein
VDDGGRILNYPPNQGVWGTAVKTKSFADDGLVVVAVGDIGEAYAPSCAEDGCKKRSVERLTRSFVYVRPSLLVLRDEVELDRSDIAVTWAAHVTTSPTLDGNLASAVVGSSRVDVRTLLPPGGKPVALREPTPSGEGSHRLNQPWGPVWRVEVSSPRDAEEREFLHFIVAGPKADAPPVSELVTGKGLRGASGRADARRVVVLFAEGNVAARSASLGGPADVTVLAGLAPRRRYRVTLEPGGGCTLRLSESADARDPLSTSAGFLRADATRCVP